VVRRMAARPTARCLRGRGKVVWLIVKGEQSGRVYRNEYGG
jgi:hypothetical protein